MSRRQDRRDDEMPVRLSWLEDDLDRVDEKFVEVYGRIQHNRTNADMAFQGLKRDYDKRLDDLEDRFDKVDDRTTNEVAGIRKVMVGVLISTLSVAIAIVAQVLIMRGGAG